MKFVAESRPDSPIRTGVRQVDWRQVIASDKELMDRATGKWWEQEAVLSPLCLGSWLLRLRSRRLSCGALDPEFDGEEDAPREMYSQSDL